MKCATEAKDVSLEEGPLLFVCMCVCGKERKERVCFKQTVLHNQIVFRRLPTTSLRLGKSDPPKIILNP